MGTVANSKSQKRDSSLSSLMWRSGGPMISQFYDHPYKDNRDLGPNPIQRSSTDAAMAMGCALHPAVEGQPWRPLHCSCINAGKLDTVGPLLTLSQ